MSYTYSTDRLLLTQVLMVLLCGAWGTQVVLGSILGLHAKFCELSSWLIEIKSKDTIVPN